MMMYRIYLHADGSVDKAAWDIRRARRTAAAEEERRAAAIAGCETRYMTHIGRAEGRARAAVGGC